MQLDTLASETEFEKGDRQAGGLQSPRQPAIFRVGSRDTGGKFPVCVRKVVAALNDVQNPIKHWTEEDISRAHRTGQSRTDGPRAMIVRFSRWKDKMAVLSDQTLRDGTPA